MSGKTFVGNANSIAQLPKEIYVGDSNGKAVAVKEIYVGDSNGKAQQVWPNYILPSNYKMVEYIKIYNFGANGFSAVSISESKRMRLVTSFKIHQKNDEDSSCLFYMGSNEEVAYGGSSIGNKLKVAYNGKDFYTNVNEGILSNKLYSIDFANLNNGLARFYLYCEDGYYSRPANNLLGSASKITASGEGVTLLLVGAKCSTSFYMYELYDNSGSSSGNLLHELVPCYEGTREDFAAGFYDIIDRIFYPIVPMYYHLIDITLGPDV